MLLAVHNYVGHSDFSICGFYSSVEPRTPGFRANSGQANIGDRPVFAAVRSPGASRDMYARRAAVVPAANTTTS